MATFLTRALLAAAIAIAFCTSAAIAQEKTVPWTVVQVDDDFQALEKTKLKDFQKGVNDTYAAEKKAYDEAKKAATKNKEKFTDQPPKRKKVKLTNKTFKSEEEANTYVQQMRDELEKKKKKPA